MLNGHGSCGGDGCNTGAIRVLILVAGYTAR